MSLTELIYKVDPAKVGSLVLDASVSEEHTAESDVTDSPVEEGSDVSDNIRRKPKQLKITGVVTNTPLEFLNFNSGDRAKSAWLTLNDIKDNGILVTVVTTLQTYDNMAIVSISVPRDAARGNVLEFTATMREIFTAKSQTVAETTTKKPVSKGNRSTPEASEPVRQSLLRKLGTTVTDLLSGG